MQRIVFASGNKGKIAELSSMVSHLDFTLLPQSEFDVSAVEETGKTFIENAIIKARHACEQTGLPAIADDSGLQVAALGGAPGIYSARYAGPGAKDSTNVDKLLGDLEAFVHQGQRHASFVCALVLMRHQTDPVPIVCQAIWEGYILNNRQGDQGFGYDPVFYVPSEQCSAAQLDPALKNRISHRGQAFTLLVQELAKLTFS